MTAVRPFGSWHTPVTSELVVASASRVIDVRADGDDLVWVESRPGEGGRPVQVRRRADGTITELVGGDANDRTAVHEYGGRAWRVHDGAVWYGAWADPLQRRAAPDRQAVTLLHPAPEETRRRPQDRRVGKECVRTCSHGLPRS